MCQVDELEMRRVWAAQAARIPDFLRDAPAARDPNERARQERAAGACMMTPRTPGDETIIALWTEGAHITDICAKTGFTSRRVRRRLYACRQPAAPASLEKVSACKFPDRNEAIIARFQVLRSQAEVAREFGVTRNVVIGVVKRAGLSGRTGGS